MEIAPNNILQKSLELKEQGFVELKKTHKYSKCNALFINKLNNTFWFTTLETAKHTMKVANSKFKIAS